MVEYDTITIHYGQKNYLIIIGQSYSTLVEARNTIGFIRKWLLWSWEFVPFGKFGMVSDSGEPPPFELVPSATRIIIVVKTIPSSDGMKSVITYSALFPAAYAAMPETKAAEYIAPDSIIMIMTGKRVEDMPACFSSRWLRQIWKEMSPVQVTLVARVITQAEVTQGTRTDSNTTLPGLAFEAAQHKPADEAVVPTTIIIGKTIIGQCLFQTM